MAQAVHQAGIPSVIGSRFPLSIRGSSHMVEEFHGQLPGGPTSLEQATGKSSMILAGALEGHDDGVFSAAFSPDGARVITASRDGKARVWLVGKSALVPPLWRAIRDCLSVEERRVLLGETLPTALAGAAACFSCRVWYHDPETGFPAQVQATFPCRASLLRPRRGEPPRSEKVTPGSGNGRSCSTSSVTRNTTGYSN